MRPHPDPGSDEFDTGADGMQVNDSTNPVGREQDDSQGSKAVSGSGAQDEPDFYYDDQGQFVFTRAYHLRRGFCCLCGCLHCPYDDEGNPLPA